MRTLPNVLPHQTRRRSETISQDIPMADQTKPLALQAVKGMNDILPPDSARWEWFEDKVRALMQRYGYANVRTPIVEPTADRKSVV